MKALDAAVGQIEKQFGKGSIMRLGQNNIVAPVESISTGAISIDYALGIGGVPRGRVIEIFGPESSGKTTLALQIIAEAQKKGGMAAFVDAEHALDAAYAKKLGVDLDNLLVSQPDNGEQALEIVEVIIRSNSVDVVVVDSVAALVPRAEIEGEMGEAQMGLQARLMSQALRKLTGAVSKSKASLIFINQLREKIGVMFGNPETTTGGRALKFYSSVRIDIRRIGAIKDGEDVVGNRTRVKIVKNKMAPPFREAEFDIMYGEGVSREGDLIDIAVEHKIIEKSGAWFAYGGERLGQGRENVKNFLKENVDLRTAIEEKVRKALGMVVKEVDPKPSGSRRDWTRSLLHYVIQLRRPWLDDVMLLASALGAGGFVWSSSARSPAFSRGTPRRCGACGWPSRSRSCSSTSWLKPFVNRARPFESLPEHSVDRRAADQSLIPIRPRGDGVRRSPRGHANDSGGRLDPLAAGRCWCPCRASISACTGRATSSPVGPSASAAHGLCWAALRGASQPESRGLQDVGDATEALSLAPSKSAAIYSEVSPIGQVAQLVEHATENRSVGGSIPSLATTISFGNLRIAIVDGKSVFGPLSPNCPFEGRELRDAGAEVGFADDVVAFEHRSRLVAGQHHRHTLGHAGAH